MLTEPQFTVDELAQLHLLVSQDFESSRVELHHTAGWSYRDLKRRMAQEMALLEKMEQALPVLQTGIEDQWATDGGTAPAA
jgi:hypothetical protein